MSLHFTTDAFPLTAGNITDNKQSFSRTEKKGFASYCWNEMLALEHSHISDNDLSSCSHTDGSDNNNCSNNRNKGQEQKHVRPVHPMRLAASVKWRSRHGSPMAQAGKNKAKIMRSQTDGWESWRTKQGKRVRNEPLQGTTIWSFRTKGGEWRQALVSSARDRCSQRRRHRSQRIFSFRAHDAIHSTAHPIITLSLIY